MKLLYLPSYFPPEAYASRHLDDERFAAFALHGIQMEVHTPVPTRGVDGQIRRDCPKKEMFYGGQVDVRRFAVWQEGKNPIGRALRYFYCWFRQFWIGCRAKDINAIYMVSTPPIQGLLGAALKKIKKVPFVYNLQDIFPDSLIGAGLAKKGGLLWKVGRWMEDMTYRNADRIIVISEDFKANIMAKGVPEEKVTVVYNWVDEKTVVPIEKADNPLYEELGLSRADFHVVYAGNLGEAQYLDVMIEAASRLINRKDIQFVIFGTGGLETNLKAEVVRRGLQNVRFFPLQPYERVSQVYSLGDLCVVSCKAGLGGSAMPSKTWTIMSTGRAVLVHFDEGELHQIIQRVGCGLFTLSGDIDAFVKTIVQMAAKPEECRQMGLRGRHFILKNLTCEAGTSQYIKVLNEVVGQWSERSKKKRIITQNNNS